jgi:hypothetical protein
VKFKKFLFVENHCHQKSGSGTGSIPAHNGKECSATLILQGWAYVVSRTILLKKNILNQISRTNQSPGKDWMYLLRETMGSSRNMFFRSFKILEEEFERKMYEAAKVFNVDETCLCIVES